MINPQEEAIKRLVQQAKTGAQRTPLVPAVDSDPDSPPIGSMWIRRDESKAYLKISDTVTQLLGSGDGGGGEPGGPVVIGDRSISGIKLMLNTITANEIGPSAVGSSELANGAVTGLKWASTVNASSNLVLDAKNIDAQGLRVNVPFNHGSDVVRFDFDGASRFRLTPTRLHVGNELVGAAVSIQTSLTDTALRVRGSGGLLLLERQNGTPMMSVDSQGNLTVAGSINSQSGDSGTAGSLAVQGALTVTDQANLLAGLQVAERVDFLADFEVDGQVTINNELFLPDNYSARLGQAVHLRTLLGTPNRMLLEGVSDIGVAEIQLGTGGPVLRGSFAEDDAVYIGSDRIMTSGASGILGSQLATDTITGGTGPGLGNIAAETITGYNIKNGSITSTELSPGAVVRAALAEGAVGPVQLADGSVIDRVVASMGVGKLISGTLNADEVFMGPSGHIYLGPTTTAEIFGERIQLDMSGIRAYNEFGTALAEFTPGGFALRTASSGARLELDAANGLELFGPTGERTGALTPSGEFQLDSLVDGARMSLNSQEGVQFYAGATRNLAFNPGFIGSSEHELPVAAEASDDQRHVFAGEWAVKFRSTNPNTNAPSYVDVPFKNTVGTGTSFTRTRTNACTNPALTTTIAGWLGSVAGGSSPTRVSVLGFRNDYAAQVTAGAAGLGEIRAPILTVSGGQQWALSALVRISAPATATATIVWYDVGGTVVRSDVSDPVTLAGNVVTQVGMVGVAPATATSARLQISATLQATDTMQVSCALYERASGIDVYFDGDQDGYQWDGSPGISTSSLIPVPVQDSVDNLISIFVWSDVPAWTQIEGWDTTAGVSRGLSDPTRLIPNQWSRVYVRCTGVMDKVRLHYASEDPSRQVRIIDDPIWWSGLQVEADKDTPTPFCSGNEPGCRWEGLPGQSASVRDRDVVVTQISPTLGTTVSGAIVGGSLTSASFFAGRIFATNITGSNITGSVLRGNLIHGDQILAGTISGESIAARTIDAGSIKVGTLTGEEIRVNSLTGDRIQVDTLEGNRLKASSVTADKFVADLIVAGTAGGDRVQISRTSGIEQWRGGVRTVRIPASGDAEFRGVVHSGNNSQYIRINPAVTAADRVGPRMFFVDDNSNYRMSLYYYGDRGFWLIREDFDYKAFGGFLQLTSLGAYIASMDVTEKVRGEVGTRNTGSAYMTAFPASGTGNLGIVEVRDNSNTLIEANGQAVLRAGRTASGTAGTAFVLSERGNVSVHAPEGDVIIQTDDGRIWIEAGDLSFRFVPGDSQFPFQFWRGSTYIKSFVIDHPDDPDRWLVHGCTESPMAGVEYWGEVEIVDGEAVVELPSYFESLTLQENRQVFLLPIDELCAVTASRIENGRFRVRCSGPDGTRVSWMVKAERSGAAGFEVEPLKSEVSLSGSGPYQWVTSKDESSANRSFGAASVGGLSVPVSSPAVRPIPDRSDTGSTPDSFRNI